MLAARNVEGLVPAMAQMDAGELERKQISSGRVVRATGSLVAKISPRTAGCTIQFPTFCRLVS